MSRGGQRIALHSLGRETVEEVALKSELRLSAGASSRRKSKHKDPEAAL